MTSYTSGLLLLPSLPSSTSISTFRTAYGPGLVETFRRAVANATQPGYHLDIAIYSDEQHLPIGKPRSYVYTQLRLALSQFFSLICAILATEPNLDPTEKVDFRVLFVHEQQPEKDESLLPFQGPILTFRALASAPRQWSDVFSLDGASGERMLQKFIAFRKALSPTQQLGAFEVHRVMGGTSIRLASDIAAASDTSPGQHHYSIAVGGTFDHLHAGHKLLLTATALVLEPWTESARNVERILTVGITGDALLTKKKYAEVLESWDDRQQAVIDFLSALLDLSKSTFPPNDRFTGSGPNSNAVHYKFDGNLTVRCVEISDPYGPTITDKEISALVVSGETRSGGKAVNDKRVEKGWGALEVFEIDVLDQSPTEESGITETESFQSKISSTAIRQRLQEQRASG